MTDTITQRARVETVTKPTGKLHRLWIDDTLVNIYVSKAKANKAAERFNAGNIVWRD